MEFAVRPVFLDNFSIDIKNDIIVMKGSLFSQNSEEIMEPFIDAFHDEAVAKGVKQITVDIVELTFLNSSGIKVLAAWISNVDILSEEQRYQILFRCNSAHLWQETSITTLALLSPEVVKKEFVGNFDSYV